MIAGGVWIVGLLFGLVAVADALRSHLVPVDSLRVTPTTELAAHSRPRPLDSSKTQFRDALRGPVATTPAPRSDAAVICSVPIHRRGVERDTAGHPHALPFPVPPARLLH